MKFIKILYPTFLHAWPIMQNIIIMQVEDFARLSFQKKPVYIDVDDGRSRVCLYHYESLDPCVVH